MDRKKAYVVIYFDKKNEYTIAHSVGAFFSLEDAKRGMINWILQWPEGRAYDRVQRTLFAQGICIPNSSISEEELYKLTYGGDAFSLQRSIPHQIYSVPFKELFKFNTLPYETHVGKQKYVVDLWYSSLYPLMNALMNDNYYENK